MIDPTARVHPTADVETGVTIGPGTAVWHRAQIRTGARIGRDGVIGRDVFIDEDVTLGDMVKVQNGALIYQGVTVEDGVFIGPGAILTNDRRPRSLNAVGELARGADWTISPIRVGSGASIGAGAIIVAGHDVGPHAMIGAGAVVTHDVPAHALVVGNPDRRVGWVCTCGTRLVEPSTSASATAPDRTEVTVDLVCPDCERGYGALDDGDGLRRLDRPAVAIGGPA